MGWWFRMKVDPPQKVDWEAKDRRIVRQNALSQANSFLSTLAGIGELEKKGGKEIQDIMFLIAGRCEKWVYGEYNPLAGADSPIKEAEVEKNV